MALLNGGDRLEIWVEEGSSGVPCQAIATAYDLDRASLKIEGGILPADVAAFDALGVEVPIRAGHKGSESNPLNVSGRPIATQVPATGTGSGRQSTSVVEPA